MSSNARDNSRRLAQATSFDQVFELVKRASEKSLGMHRAGLTLVLGDISNNVGAYHELGSNAIVMNRNIVKIIWRSTRSKTKRNAFTFMILLHEYLHSLGFTDDAQVRDMGKKISDEFLGPGHVAGDMAVKSLDKFFPMIPQLAMFRDKGQFETVQRFDSSSTPYIR
ncbi:MAG: hypothetical protein OK449_07110 [Thaumarchaeota archaeon]|nr:hypothetical protein [Nitrososphaerota archaeon]